jgi:hypothetical protein
MQRHTPAYGIFIIESMDWDNESRGKLDGYILKSILDLCDIPNQYLYIRTRQEFEHAMKLFEETDYGFLHLSCHGNESRIFLTMDEIKFEDLGAILGPYLKYRRLFLSACKAACFSLAEYLIPRHHCYSIMGAYGTIDYDKAAIFWSSYYYLIYRDDQERMWQKDIIPTLKNITKTFSEALNYFSIINERYPESKFSLREIRFRNGNIDFDQVKATRFENLYWADAIDPDDPVSGPIETISNLGSVRSRPPS